MEKISKPEVKTQDTQDAYESYLTRVSDNLFTDPDHPERGPRSRSIVYVPYRGFSEQLQQGCPKITFTDSNSPEVVEAVSAADVIVNIARGEEVVEAEIGHPDRNVKLPPESVANTDMVSDLYVRAIESGNTNVQVVHTGRMNNKTIAMATAMPVLAESAGLNYEDVIHTSDAKIHQLVKENQVNLSDFMHEVDTNPTMQDMQVCVRALRRIYEARNIDPDTASASELTDALLDEYEKYPRISTSTLMKEQMLRNVAEKLRSEGKSEKEINEVVGKLDEFTDEEPDSVDTVTNFTNSIPIILSKQLIKEGYDADEVGAMSTEQKMELLADTEMTAVFVADIAHMPRVMWLADYLMPDNFKLVFVESRTDLDEETLQKSMEREKRSLKLTRNWLPNQMGTRNPAKVGKLADEAYWGKDSISNKEINASIQQAK
ncbi:hypothetical protein [Candidatus Nanosynsacchari sp. TM7_ANC_38.39_G1_1]|uniref:hypothetical protein n=1 Tax=Candidatus Nanosynsacchari sp. TM7_ANC_38.39_G1_1 TaxID=1986206 RepID=UPI00101B9D6F|nr:hypothetical protein [Candidatus Nanosynsacchari sp. TM7_ANC_38.39_G1_1]RYC73504.1 hypothetical protein G1ANC_00420 [Candidatus Nanosynsacchari sp. TM7_ANC_38.39_G1_1]